MVSIADVGFTHVAFHAEFDVNESNVNVWGLRLLSYDNDVGAQATQIGRECRQEAAGKGTAGALPVLFCCRAVVRKG